MCPVDELARALPFWVPDPARIARVRTALMRSIMQPVWHSQRSRRRECPRRRRSTTSGGFGTAIAPSRVMRDAFVPALPSTAQRRIKVAELSSSFGAGVLGLGIGVLAASALRALGIPLLIIGFALHAWGMTDKHRIEAHGSAAPVWWSTALYWVCWIGLVAIAGYAVLRSV